ncbi:hypothetical protein [Planobispora takensis]|uniref:hypothetical protein n=1 Tax=Planobispora takensis TaxID=1367882 RepID=UPI001941A8EA|nr:hypothetical protein [Planobispora takensis]
MTEVAIRRFTELSGQGGSMSMSGRARIAVTSEIADLFCGTNHSVLILLEQIDPLQ